MPRGRFLNLCAPAILSLAALSQPAPHASSFQDVIPDLAARIAAAAAPADRVQLLARDRDDTNAPERQAIERELARALAARGVSAVDRSEAAIVTYTCSENVRSRLCAAEVSRDGMRYAVVAERWRSPGAAPPATAPLVVVLEPLVAQRAPILDVATAGSRTLVLDPAAVSLHERTDEGLRLVTSRPVGSARPWPRDVRGRLRVEGSTVAAFLPGTTCRGTLDPLSIACTDSQREWPVGIGNLGIAAGANEFTDETGVRFFSAASLGPDAGAKWLVARAAGVTFLDESRRPVLVLDDPMQHGGEVASIASACAAGSHVVMAARAASDPRSDTLRLFSVRDRELSPVTPPVMLAGTATALWSTSDPTRALVVSRNDAAGVYEAFHARLSCGR